MTEVTDREAEQLASAFRPHRRPLMIAVVANVSMAVLLLGVPYLRGRQLAAAERRQFVEFARCLVGGETAPTPGMSLPRGERAHFAEKVLLSGPEWPGTCRPLLRALAPEEALFLWPSVKQTGADLRAAVALVERELDALDKRRKQGLGRVPQRPLDAFKRLQAASVLYARAAGADKHLDNDALVFKSATSALAPPARLPLMIGETQQLDVWSHDGTVEALAVDGRGLSYLRLDDGKVDRGRVRKTSFLRGTVRAGHSPYVVWAMPDARCADRDDRCVGKPTGIAPFEMSGEVLGEPRWKLPGHPGGRLDRVLDISETGRVDLIARSNPGGGLELLRFRLPEASVSTPASDKAATLEALETWPVLSSSAGATSATLLAGEPRGVARATAAHAAEGGPPPTPFEASVVWSKPDTPPLILPPAGGSGAWITACSRGDARVIAYGTDSELRVVRVDPATNTATPLLTHTIPTQHQFDDTDAARDQLRLACDEQRAQLVFIAGDRQLQQITCSAESCSKPAEIAKDVAQFAALLRGDATLIAYHHGLREPAVKVLRLDAQGAPAGAATIPAACWEPLGGMCGTATLVSDAQRVLLLARDGPDLLALESTDQGQSFKQLSGFTRQAAFEPSTTAPLQQHRKRKGLE